MGITGLLPFVKDASELIHISKYAGKVLAIDTYCWLHRGSFACAEKLAKKEKTDQYVKYCMKYINLLEQHRIKPILVFDGCQLPSKEMVERQRRERRKEYLERGKQSLREGKLGEARDCFTKCISVTPAMALAVIETARNRGIDCIVAPYEADAQLAYLSKHNIAQGIITEDSDLLCFGCKNVIFKLDLTGRGQEILLSNLGRVKNLVGFTPDLFRQMCILSGCDYLSSVKGVGLTKACKALKLSKSKDSYQVARKLHQYIKGLSPVDASYGAEFERADKTFLYQLVFDPVQRKIRPLNEYPPGFSVEDFPYAGPVISDEEGLQIALGNIDINTMVTVSYFDVDDWVKNRKPADGRDSIWHQKNIENQIFTSDVNIPVFVAQTTEPVVTSSKVTSSNVTSPKHHLLGQQNSNVITAVDVLTAVTNATDEVDKSYSLQAPLVDKISKSPEKRLINNDDMSELMKLYHSEKVPAPKKTDHPKLIVKSRYFAPPRSLVDHDLQPLSESKSTEILTAHEHALNKDDDLDGILQELQEEANKPSSPAERMNPFAKQQHNWASKRKRGLNLSTEGLKTLQKRKKKKLIKHFIEAPIVGASSPSKEQFREDERLLSESIPLLDGDEADEEVVEISPIKITENYTDENDSRENHKSCLDECIPILDHTPNDLQKCKEPLNVMTDLNNCETLENSSSFKDYVISVSSDCGSENEVSLAVEPKVKSLGVNLNGKFHTPVKLNLSKYFGGAKASGLRKPSARKVKPNKNQPSIASFLVRTTPT